MTENEMLRVVQAQLATDLNCLPADLNGEKDGFVFVEARENPGRRLFPRGDSHFDMLTMGKSIVVSATPEILEIAKAWLSGKSRDAAFSMPFVNGHSMYYLPDLGHLTAIAPPPEGFVFETFEKDALPALYRIEGFRNAMSYDIRHPRPDVLATVARRGGRVAGIAGASDDCAMMWQVGIDVLSEYRNRGLAAFLVNRLTLDILERGYIPYYGTSSANVASQRVAHRAGYRPAWVCAYTSNFEGLLAPT